MFSSICNRSYFRSITITMTILFDTQRARAAGAASDAGAERGMGGAAGEGGGADGAEAGAADGGGGRGEGRGRAAAGGGQGAGQARQG